MNEKIVQAEIEKNELLSDKGFIFDDYILSFINQEVLRLENYIKYLNYLDEKNG
jgi:hypothetical protein